MLANYDDVVLVEIALRASLREGEEKVVPFYIRDILNDAEDVSLWQPNAAIPLAIALAEVRRKGVRNVRVLEDAKTRLRSWYDSLQGGDSTRFASSVRMCSSNRKLMMPTVAKPPYGSTVKKTRNLPIALHNSTLRRIDSLLLRRERSWSSLSEITLSVSLRRTHFRHVGSVDQPPNSTSRVSPFISQPAGGTG